MDQTEIERAVVEAYEGRGRGVPFYDRLPSEAQELLQALAERGRNDGGRLPNISAVRRILARHGHSVSDSALRHWFQREVGE